MVKKCFFILCIGMTQIVVGQITSTASGNWSNAAIWDGGVIPDADDDVVIEHDVVLDFTTSVNSLTLGQQFGAGAGVGTLQITSNRTLTVATGTTDLDRNGNSLTVDAGSSFIKTSGDLSISATGTITINGAVDVQSGDFFVSGGNSGSLSVGSSGDFDVSGDFNWAHGNRTVTFEGEVTVGSLTASNGSGTTFIIESGATFTITNALTATITQNYTVRGTMNVGSISATGGSPQFDIEAGGVLNVTGDVLIASSADLNINSASGSVSVGGDFEISGGGAAVVDGDLVVSGTITASSPITGTGTVTTTGCTGDCTGVTVDPSLPVELAFFKGRRVDGRIVLEWQTVIEINNDFFVIESSHDGISFEELSRVNGHGDSKRIIDYSYEFEHPASSAIFIRLKQVDYDGAFEYHNILFFPAYSDNPDSYYQVYPSILSSGNTLNLNRPVSAWIIYNAEGKVLDYGNESKIDISLPAGSYMISLENAAFRQTRRFIVN